MGGYYRRPRRTGNWWPGCGRAAIFRRWRRLSSAPLRPRLRRSHSDVCTWLLTASSHLPALRPDAATQRCVLYLGQPTAAAVAGFDYIQTDAARVVNVSETPRAGHRV